MSSESHDRRLDALILDLVEWLAVQPRPYAEVMDAWRTSCARLPVWEEAVDRGLVVSEMVAPRGVLVSVTPAGRVLLEKSLIMSGLYQIPGPATGGPPGRRAVARALF
jgi:hypothetical protein